MSVMDRKGTHDPGEILSVSELSGRLRQALQSRFGAVWVTGEVSDLSRPSSGHVYFTLKDADSRLSAVLWRSTAQRLSLPLDDGLQVTCFGGIDVYAPRGSYQLIVREIVAAGVGHLQQAFRLLHARLRQEGLFDAERKRPIPSLAQRIAVVTSTTAAALHDFLEVARRRWLGPEILIVPTPVQGAQAVPQIVAALRRADQLQPPADVIVLMRGGGSLEDLWCFNDESVVRAIVASRTPVVTAIGHEIDITLADLAADCRALTPSEAAERTVGSAEELRRGFDQRFARLRTLAMQSLSQARMRLDGLARRPVFSRPWDRIVQLSDRLDAWDTRIRSAVDRALAGERERIESLANRLHALSPLAVLNRGYSVTMKSGEQRPLTSMDGLVPGAELHTRLVDGWVWSIVDRTAKDHADSLRSRHEQEER